MSGLIAVIIVILQYVLIWAFITYLKESVALGLRKPSDGVAPHRDYDWLLDEKYSLLIAFACIPYVGIAFLPLCLIGLVCANKTFKINIKKINPMRWLMREILAPRKNV